jgi:hypothetical protein
MNQQQAIATVRRAFGAPGSKPYPRYRRIGPVAGLAGLACYTAGSLTALPGPAAATTTVTARLAAGHGSVLAGVALMFLALPFLLVFLGFLAELLARAEGRPWLLTFLSAGAWLVLFVLIAAGLIPLAAVAWRGAAATPPGIVRLAIDIANLSQYALSAPVAAASELAPAIVIWRSRALPRWLAGLALLGVAASVAELAGLAATRGTDAGGYAAGAGPVLWVLWAAALAVTSLAAKPRAAGPVTGAPATAPNGPPAASAS